MEVNKKYARTTPGQLEAYIDFVNEHPEFLVGKNTPDAPQRMQELWEELSGRLNSLIGPTRTAAVWKDNLRNWRKQLKAKARKVRAEIQRTGGGASSATGLTTFEERALQSLGTVCITGLNGVDLGFGGESNVLVTCESPIEFIESVILHEPLMDASPAPPPLFHREQPATTPRLIASIPATGSTSPVAAGIFSAAETQPAATSAPVTPAVPTSAALPSRSRSHRKARSSLEPYLDQERRLRMEEMAMRREEMAMRREEMAMRREEHNQFCAAVTALTAAVTELNVLLSSQGGG